MKKNKLIKMLDNMMNESIKKTINDSLRGYGVEKASEKRKIYTDWSPYDADVSDRFKKMVMSLLNYRNKLGIDIYEDRINITTGDIKNLKKPKSRVLSGDDDYLEIVINKKGFSLNRCYSIKSSYFDENVFNELHELIVAKLKEINANNFNDILDGYIH